MLLPVVDDALPERGADPRQGLEPIVKILDFGVVKELDPTQTRITKTGASMGSPAYMSPEQVRAHPNIDRRRPRAAQHRQGPTQTAVNIPGIRHFQGGMTGLQVSRQATP